MNPINLREHNIFAHGYIVELADDKSILKTEKLVYNPSADKDKTQILVEGDTLDDIAYVRYGDSRWWHVLAYVNSIQNPFELPVGTEIIIPDLDVIKASR